jgi:MFS family permease
MSALIVGRVIAGIGGAGLYLGMLNLIAINTLEKERPAYMGGTGVIWGAGTILGPVIGGAFADSSATWRWVGNGRPCIIPHDANIHDLGLLH